MLARNSVRQMGHFFDILLMLVEQSIHMHMWRQGVRIMLAGLERQTVHCSLASHLKRLSDP